MTHDDLKKQNKELVDNLFKNINYMSNEEDLAKAFMDHLQTEHRTLQASFIRLIQKILVEYSKTEYSDPRNECAVKFAKAVNELVYKDTLYIPFI